MNNPIQKPDSQFLSSGIFLFLFGIAIVVALLVLEHKSQRDRQTATARKDYRYIPSELFTYQQTSLFVCPLAGRPTCFTVWNDSAIIIGTAEPHSLSFFDVAGTLLRTVHLPEEPRAIAVGTADTIFTDKIIIAHPASIAVYAIDGRREDAWSLDNDANIRSLALTPNYLFAANTDKRCVYRFNADGHLDLTFGDFIVYASPIVLTYSHQDGLLYIANPGKHQVEVFTPDGELRPELTWGEPTSDLAGFAGCCNPIGLAVLDDGRILTVEKSVSRVKIFRDGKLDGIVAGWDILEHLPPELGRFPMPPGGRDFSAIPLADGSIAVFDYTSAVIRVFAHKPNQPLPIGARGHTGETRLTMGCSPLILNDCKPVSDTANGFDKFPCLAEFTAKRCNMHINCPVSNNRITADCFIN